MLKEKIKENDAVIYILTKKYGLMKCFIKGIFKPTSRNLTLFEPGNLNRLFIITNFRQNRIISALPIKTPFSSFKKYPYIFLWTFKVIKNLNLLETPKFVWFVMNYLSFYIKQSPKVFPYWFLYHILRDLGYQIDLDRCYKCSRKIKNFAFYDKKINLVCLYCKKQNYLKITKKDLNKARKIKSLRKIPTGKLPDFLKIIIKNRYKEVFGI